VHKAQGSEYPAVVLPVTTQHWPMLQRNLLYTGVTRGRKLVVLVAQPKAVAIAVKGQQERRRWSKLKEWLSAAPDGGSHAAAAGGLAFPISDETFFSQSCRE
jgi:exodeoxyribonuclease V alpha subunit